MRRVFWLLATILLTIPSFLSLVRPGIHNIADNMQYFRIYEMDKCFEDGQIPCRWVPDMGYGFGYPLYIYYSPGPYYLGNLIHILGFQYIDSVKILFIGGFILSAIAMFWLLSEMFSSSTLAFVGSLLYVYAPVRATQVYSRGSLSEFLAMALFPLLFLFSYKIVKESKITNIFWFGLTVFSLLITHNLMSVAFFPVLGIWMILLLVIEKKFSRAKELLLGIAIGVGLAAFFVVPLMFERGYVQLESMTGGYFDYRQHFVSLYQLFISNHWGYGSSQLGPGDDMSLSVGIVQWFLALVATIMAVVNYSKNRRRSITILVLAGISLLVIFLTHQRSSFIWNEFDFMKMFQFPWRFLVVSSFLLSILATYAISYFKNRSRIIIIISTITLFVLYGNFFKPQKWLDINDVQLLSGKEFVKQQTASIFDYLPVSATLPPNYEAPSRPEVLEGNAKVENYIKGSDFQSGSITVYDNQAKIRLPIFDFPGMEVKDNGNVIAFDHANCQGQDYCFGQITFDLTQGLHQINVNLNKTLPRIVGDLISVLTLICIPIIVVIYKKRK